MTPGSYSVHRLPGTCPSPPPGMEFSGPRSRYLFLVSIFMNQLNMYGLFVLHMNFTDKILGYRDSSLGRREGPPHLRGLCFLLRERGGGGGIRGVTTPYFVPCRLLGLWVGCGLFVMTETCFCFFFFSFPSSWYKCAKPTGGITGTQLIRMVSWTGRLLDPFQSVPPTYTPSSRC